MAEIEDFQRAVDRLKELKVTPEQVKYVGISHFHGDHTGQLAPFTNAMLLIGRTPMSRASKAGSTKRGRSSR